MSGAVNEELGERQSSSDLELLGVIAAYAARGEKARSEPTPADVAAHLAAEDAIAALYGEHGGALLRYAMHLTEGDRQRAEDLVQETMVRAWQNAAKLVDNGRESCRPWLFAVARNLSVDQYRARQSRPREVRLPSDELDIGAAGPESLTPAIDDAVVTALIVEEAISQLPEIHQPIVRKVLLEGAGTAEAGEDLGIPRGTVKSRTHYALKALKEILAKQGFELGGDAVPFCAEQEPDTPTASERELKYAVAEFDALQRRIALDPCSATSQQLLDLALLAAEMHDLSEPSTDEEAANIIATAFEKTDSWLESRRRHSSELPEQVERLIAAPLRTVGIDLPSVDPQVISLVVSIIDSAEFQPFINAIGEAATNDNLGPAIDRAAFLIELWRMSLVGNQLRGLSDITGHPMTTAGRSTAFLIGGGLSMESHFGNWHNLVNGRDDFGTHHPGLRDCITAIDRLEHTVQLAVGTRRRLGWRALATAANTTPDGSVALEDAAHAFAAKRQRVFERRIQAAYPRHPAVQKVIARYVEQTGALDGWESDAVYVLTNGAKVDFANRELIPVQNGDGKSLSAASKLSDRDWWLLHELLTDHHYSYDDDRLIAEVSTRHGVHLLARGRQPAADPAQEAATMAAERITNAVRSIDPNFRVVNDPDIRELRAADPRSFEAAFGALFHGDTPEIEFADKKQGFSPHRYPQVRKKFLRGQNGPDQREGDSCNSRTTGVLTRRVMCTSRSHTNEPTRLGD